MSLAVNARALERVCKLLDIDYQRGFREIVIDPEQTSPPGVCAMKEDRTLWVFIDAALSQHDANWIALHELKHVAHEIHEGSISQKKYEAQVVEAGFDPTVVMAVNRPVDFLSDPDDFERYRSIPFEKDADKFANEHDDLYEVIIQT